MPDGRVMLLMGLVADLGCPCVHVLPATAKRHGYKPGDYVQIDNDERGTVIVRKIAGCGMCGGMRADYIYLDGESARYLEGDIHTALRIRPAEFPLECP